MAIWDPLSTGVKKPLNGYGPKVQALAVEVSTVTRASFDASRVLDETQGSGEALPAKPVQSGSAMPLR